MKRTVPVEVLGLRRCTTCQRVVRDLEAAGVPVGSFRDLRERPLDVAELSEIVRRVGGVEKLFSRRALQYRALGLHLRTVSPSEMLELMLKEATFVTRPVLLATKGDAAMCGGGPALLRRFIASLPPG